LPSTPGVYLMKDSQDRIIYIGKAKNLKRRVTSYFQPSSSHPQKIKKMVSNLFDFDIILTDTEFEAFMLECHLIKKFKPLFNKKMKSSHSYTYIVIHLDEKLHRMELTNDSIKEEGKLYFGPFISKHTVEKAVLALKEIYKILCSSPTKKNSACLNYSLGLCIGTCIGGSAIDNHNKVISKIIDLLYGNDTSLLEEMEHQMTAAADRYDFEAATKLKNQLEAISYLIKKEKVIEFTEENKNIVMIEFLSETVCKLFVIKRNKILYSEKISVDSVQLEQISFTVKTYLENAITQHQIEVSKDELDESQIIYRYLTNSQWEYVVIPENRIQLSNHIKNVLTQLIGKKEESLR
jgi:excinuclease ABC subunit C